MADYYRTLDGFNIQTSVLRTQSGIMKNASENIYDVLENTRKRMNYMLDTKLWESDAARKLVDQYNELRTEIDKQRRDLGEYCKFLDKSADDYDSTEIGVGAGIPVK